MTSTDIEPTTETGEIDVQPILSHLNELRIRLTRAAAGLVVGTIISLFFTNNVLQILVSSYARVAPDDRLDTLRPTEGIETYFKIAILCGAIVSMPWILYQVWGFIKPGLEEKETRYVYIFIPSALLLFGIGIAFAWFILIPAAVAFLANFLPDVFETKWTSQEYIGFALSMLFWLGASFQMPIIIYFFARAGVVAWRTLRDQWRFAIVGVAILSAIITPSIDPVTMLLTMLPLLVLYILSIGVASVGQRQFERSMAVE